MTPAQIAARWKTSLHEAGHLHVGRAMAAESRTVQAVVYPIREGGGGTAEVQTTGESFQERGPERSRGESRQAGPNLPAAPLGDCRARSRAAGKKRDRTGHAREPQASPRRFSTDSGARKSRRQTPAPSPSFVSEPERNTPANGRNDGAGYTPPPACTFGRIGRRSAKPPSAYSTTATPRYWGKIGPPQTSPSQQSRTHTNQPQRNPTHEPDEKQPDPARLAACRNDQRRPHTGNLNVQTKAEALGIRAPTW